MIEAGFSFLALAVQPVTTGPHKSAHCCSSSWLSCTSWVIEPLAVGLDVKQCDPLTAGFVNITPIQFLT